MTLVAMGGYFGLELGPTDKPLDRGRGFHTIRGALLALLAKMVPVGSQKTLWFPRFTCPSLINAVATLGDRLNVRQYHIGPTLTPLDLAPAADDLVCLYNVFGLNDADRREGALMDNAHAFYAPPNPDQHAFYSPRKFVGVPDGAYLMSDQTLDPAPRFLINGRAEYLLLRLDQGAEVGFAAFQAWEEQLFSSEVRGMSRLSEALLTRIDHSFIRSRRTENFWFLHKLIGSWNTLRPQIEAAMERTDFVPYSYPLLVDGGLELRAALTGRKIFTPTLWAGLEDLNEFEQHLYKNTVHLPIDQRYNLDDMKAMVEVLVDLVGGQLPNKIQNCRH